jgi:OFA family oxalate/formate antiporter-like MFS transporter
MTSPTPLQKRWFIAFCGVAMQTMLGTAYAWSIFKQPLQTMYHWSSAQLSYPFMLMIFFLGVSAAFGGKFVDKAGVRTVALTAAVLFGAGTLLAGYGIQIGSLPLLLLGYGVIAGIGNGLGYITPVAVLVRWFPDRRGLITGIAVMGFGFGAGFIGQLAPILISNFGLASTFYILGAIYLGVMLSAALSFINPPAGWANQFVKKTKRKLKESAIHKSMTLPVVLRLPQFYIMWLVFFVNIAGGVALLSNLSPFSQSTFHISAITAGTLILMTSLCNGVGRVFWSALSEKLGRKRTFMVLIYSQIPCLFLIPNIHQFPIFAVLSCYIVFCMGGGFATMPAFAADIFGTKNMGNIYGKFLLAWSAAGVLGPILMEFAKNTWGNFNAAFLILAIIFLVIYIPLSEFLRPITYASVQKVIKGKSRGKGMKQFRGLKMRLQPLFERITQVGNRLKTTSLVSLSNNT